MRSVRNRLIFRCRYLTLTAKLLLFAKSSIELKGRQKMTVSETRFHLKHTKAVDFLSWAELECLTKALGVPHTVLRKICEKRVSPGSEGISVEQFGDIYRCKDYAEVMDFSFNIHSNEWNSDAMKVAIYVVTHRGLTFDELYNVRSAYVFYEEADTKGLTLNEHTLTRCLKMCMRVISPKKMMHRIKHMQDRFEVENRLQLNEFIELVLWCDLYNAWFDRVKKWEISGGKDNRLLWHLNDFYDFLHHHDLKLKHLLDRQYIKDEWTFVKEKLQVDNNFQEPPITPGLRLKQTERHHVSYLPVQEALWQSEFDVRRASAGGYFHDRRPQTAPQFLERKRREEAAAAQPQNGAAKGQRLSRPKSARDLIASYFDSGPKKVRPEGRAEEFRPNRPRRPHTAPVVRAEEREDLEEKMDAMQFDQSTVSLRYENYMREDLEYLRPGFWTRAGQRPVPSPPPVPKPRRRPIPARPSAEFLRKIAQQRTRRPQPVHAKACDARFRGWQPSPDNIFRGHQAVLVAPSFSNSNVGQMLDRLHRTDSEIVHKLHGDFVHLRLSRQHRRGIRPVATESAHPTTLVTHEQAVAGPAKLEVLLAPKTPPPGSRKERPTCTKPSEAACVPEVEKTDREVVAKLRAQLRRGLEARRSERHPAAPIPSATPLIAIQEEV